MRIRRSDASHDHGQIWHRTREGPERIPAAAADGVKAAVLLGSLIAAAVAALLVKHRNGIYRRLWEAETRDEDAIPDFYQHAAPAAISRGHGVKWCLFLNPYLGDHSSGVITTLAGALTT